MSSVEGRYQVRPSSFQSRSDRSQPCRAERTAVWWAPLGLKITSASVTADNPKRSAAEERRGSIMRSLPPSRGRWVGHDPEGAPENRGGGVRISGGGRQTS